MKWGLDLIRVRNLESPANIPGHLWSGGGGEGQHGMQFQPARHLGQAQIFGPEVVTPLRDAVRFVDGQQRNFCAGEPFHEGLAHEPFRRDVEQLERAAAHGLKNPDDPGGREGGVQPRRRDAARDQTFHLIFHQRNQRRNHQREPRQMQRRELIAK